MAHKLTPKQMEKLVQNQEDFKDMPPVTYMATFKLSNILSLIADITTSPDFKGDNDSLHNICISFVRMEINDNELGFMWKNNSHNENSQSVKGKTCTQVIPIITGCVTELYSDNGKTKSFKYISLNGSIPYVRPGGEGTGLIPPPPDSTGGFN
jgi:hypothetical protein